MESKTKAQSNKTKKFPQKFKIQRKSPDSPTINYRATAGNNTKFLRTTIGLFYLKPTFLFFFHGFQDSCIQKRAMKQSPVVDKKRANSIFLPTELSLKYRGWILPFFHAASSVGPGKFYII